MSNIQLIQQAAEVYETVSDVKIREFLKQLIQKLAEEL